jgi:hypothetical protein
MFQTKRILKTGALLSATVLVAACGGGGGGGGGGGNAGIAAAPPVAVTAANATEVASTGLSATDGLTGNSEGVLGVLPAAVGATASSAQLNIVETVIDQIKKAPSMDPPGFSPADVQNFSQSCDSGTISMSFNDADNDLALSTGDTVSMTANNCVFSGVSMNGSMSVTNVSVLGNQVSAPYSLQFTLQTSGFSVSAGGETVAMNGGATVAESTNDDITFTSSISGSGIRITAGGETLTLTDFQITETENQATGAYTIAINATVSSSTLGGSVRVSTDVALSGVEPFDPNAGQLTCVGNNSSATLTVIDSTSVQIELDIDDDGIADDTFTEPWAAL